MKRGVIILEWCFMCKTECESPISTLCHGQGIVVYDLSLVWCFLGHASLYAVDVFWRGRFGGRSDFGGGVVVGGTWKGVPFYLMWCLWRERNAICFDMQELKSGKVEILFVVQFIQMDFDVSHVLYHKAPRVSGFSFIFIF